MGMSRPFAPTGRVVAREPGAKDSAADFTQLAGFHVGPRSLALMDKTW